MRSVSRLDLLFQIEDCIDVKKLLYILGAQKVKEFGSSIRSECVIHGGDNPTAFSYDLNKKVWSCFSNKCGEGYRRDIYDLVYLYLLNKNGYSPKEREVFEILLSATNLKIDLDEFDCVMNKAVQDKISNIMFARQIKNKLNYCCSQNNLYLDDSLLSCYNIIVHPYLLSRGFKEEIIKFFDIRFSPTGFGEKFDDFPGRIIFPIRSIDNKLVGLSGRLASDNIVIINKYGKYKHIHSFRRNNVLYNINNALEYIKNTKTVILVEGFLDVLSLWSKGFKNVVGVMGNSVSLMQIKDLFPYFNKVYICFDADKGGREGTIKTIKLLKNICYVYYVRLPKGKDPDELSKKELWQAFLSAVKVN